MRIHMNTLAAGPDGIYQGDCECPDAKARGYISLGYAVPLGGVVETTMLAPAESIPAPVVELRLRIGKYKGKSIAEVFVIDPKYVTDFLTKNVDEQIAAAAKALVT